jgi:hypothetical protein
MPVIRGSLNAGSKPEWSDVTAAGTFRVSESDGRFDRHFHECDEYWLIYAGKAKVLSENVEFYVQPGDIVCTKASEEHDVLEVYESLEAFYMEGATPVGGRVGHLHKTPELALGHDVPHLPLPTDFPS